MATPRKNPRYLAALAIVSLTILIAGAFLRPERGRGPDGEEATTVVTPSPTDLARLQRLTQRRSVEAVAQVFSDLAAQVEGRVLRLQGAARTALVWDRNRAVTAAGEPVHASELASARGNEWRVTGLSWSPLSPIAVVDLDGDAAIRSLPALPGRFLPARRLGDHGLARRGGPNRVPRGTSARRRDRVLRRA